MEKQRNHSQLTDEDNSPERTNSERGLFSLIATDFKKQIMKILKELRKAINRNAEYCKNELETIKGAKEN